MPEGRRKLRRLRPLQLMPPAYSMTGYGRASAETDEASLTLTLRSVNHRFLDMQLRLPADLEALDLSVRREVKRRIRRGQLQITAALRWSRPPQTLAVNRPLVDAYMAALRSLAKDYGIHAEPDLTAVLRLPGAASVDAGALDDERMAALRETVLQCLQRALDELKESRRQEAAGIVEEMRERAKAIRQDVERLREARSGVVPKLQQRLEKKLADLLAQAQIEPQRLAQEAALLADRTDISEELQRLAAHAERLLEMLREGGELGKRIDYLAQEMNREANTILSKSSPLGPEGLPATEAGLRLKAEIDKIREQAQNLE